MSYHPSQVCGVYRVEGENPGSSERAYEGELEIREVGDVLLGHWIIGPHGQVLIGTGLLSGDSLAFAFNYLDPLRGAATGLVVYEVVGRGTLRGRWTGFGSPEVGRETCVLISGAPELH